MKYICYTVEAYVYVEGGHVFGGHECLGVFTDMDNAEKYAYLLTKDWEEFFNLTKSDRGPRLRVRGWTNNKSGEILGEYKAEGWDE